MNRLPFELERQICEMAIHWYPRLHPTIILVARRFHEWFEPELYRIIRSGDNNVIVPRSLYLNPPKKAYISLSPNTELELNIKRLATFGPHVRHIFLQSRSSKEIRQILDHCPNVQSLSLWWVHGNCRDILLPALEDLSNRRTLKLLSFDPSAFFEMPRTSDLPIPFAQPAFSSLTHLDIDDVTPNWKRWAQIADMPRLTHLMMGGVGTSEPRFILQVLKECKLLELLVVFKTEGRDDDDDSAILNDDDDSTILDDDDDSAILDDDDDSVILDDDDSKMPTSGELESLTGDYRVVALNPYVDLCSWGQDHWVIAEMVKDVRLKYKGIK